MSADRGEVAERLAQAEADLSALRAAHAHDRIRAKAQALREAAANTLAAKSWQNLSWPRRLQVAASHGAALRFSPEQIAHWLNARADHLDAGLGTVTATAPGGSEGGDRLAVALDLGQE